jgi:ribosomal protein S18 acetylase RimI-like enzyme
VIEVRVLAPDEPGIDELAAAAADLVERAYEAIPNGWPLDEDGYRAELRDVPARLRSAEVAVAFLDGVLAGCVTYIAPGSALDEHHDGEPSFRMLGVGPEAGGRGVGTALVHWVVERARASGHRHLWLYTAEPMQVAQGLYRRLGFTRLSEHDWTFAPERTLLAFRLDLMRR